MERKPSVVQSLPKVFWVMAKTLPGRYRQSRLKLPEPFFTPGAGLKNQLKTRSTKRPDNRAFQKLIKTTLRFYKNVVWFLKKDVWFL